MDRQDDRPGTSGNATVTAPSENIGSPAPLSFGAVMHQRSCASTTTRPRTVVVSSPPNAERFRPKWNCGLLTRGGRHRADTMAL